MFNNYNFSLHPATSPFINGVYMLDQYIRQDFYNGYVVSEPDYISTLMSYIRLFLRSNNLAKHFYTYSNFKVNKGDEYSIESKVLDRSSEVKCGCDAIIVFRIKNKAKVCMFEAKSIFPKTRLSWDQYQSGDSTGSHFHHQLERQTHWIKTSFIWELFINNQRPGMPLKFFDTYGSTCVWHEDAYKYSNENITKQIDMKTRKARLWDNQHLESCIEQSKTNPLNIADILNYVLFENKDKEIEIENELISLKSDNSLSVYIPTNMPNINDYIYNIFEIGVQFIAYFELNEPLI